MKKAFISIALAAALFCGANAQTTPTVPGWYSYQGVYDDRNADIEVVFYVVNAEDGTAIYVENHKVTTSSTGTFICKLGEGTPAENSTKEFANIDWTAANYEVQTWINGVLYGTAELGAVPYATVAEKALGVEGVDNIAGTLEEIWMGLEQKDEHLTQAINAQAAVDAEQNQYIEGMMEMVEGVATLATGASNIAIANEEAIDALKDQVVYATEQVDNANLGVTMLNNLVNALAADNEINISGIAEAEKSILNISEEIPGIKGSIETLKAEVELNSNGLAEAEKAIMEISEEFPGIRGTLAALKAEVELNSDGLAEAEKAIMEISEELPGIKGEINKLNQYVEGAYEQIENVATLATTTSQIATANEAAVEEMKDQIVYATEQVDNANLAVTMLNNVVNDLAAEVELNSTGLAETEKAITEISEELPGIKAEINKLNQYVEGAYEQIESVQTLATTVSQIATANEEAVEALKVEVALNTTGLAEAEKSISEISEEFPGIKGEINKLNQYMEGAYEQIESVQTLATTVSQIATANEEAVEALKGEVALNTTGLAEAEKSISEISEEIPGIKGEVNKLNQYMEGAYEQIESVQTLATTVSQIATANEEAIDALKARVAELEAKLNN